MADVPNWRGMPLRCVMCGKTSDRSVGIRSDFVLCEGCSAANSSSLMGTERIGKCVCGYRFLPEWAEWYFEDESTASCPHCGIQLAGSGAAVIDVFGGFKRL